MLDLKPSRKPALPGGMTFYCTNATVFPLSFLEIGPELMSSVCAQGFDLVRHEVGDDGG
jgi:hypothetical protein